MMQVPFPKSEMGLKGNDVIRGGAIEARVDFDVVLEPDEMWHSRGNGEKTNAG